MIKLLSILMSCHETESAGCGCSDGCHSEPENLIAYFIRIIIAVVLLLINIIFKLDIYSELTLYIISYLLVGYQIALKAIKNLFKGLVFDENFLLTIASLGAFYIGEQTEAVAVLIFYSIGEFLQELAVKRSKDNIVGLMDIRPDIANLKKDKDIIVVHSEQVNLGDIIIVKPGEKVPLDGVVIKGSSFIDVMALTGEANPQRVTAKDEILSGVLSIDGLLEIKVTKTYQNSTVAKILHLVETAGNRKAESEKLITRFAKVYTPLVVGIALFVIIIPPLLNYGSFNDWLYRGLSFLIIACPCALVISIPLSYFGGIGAAATKGILIKGGNYLEKLKDLKTVIFDKTGTITKGKLVLSDIICEKNVNKDDLLYMAALVEGYSNHPLAQAIVSAYGKKIDQEIEIKELAGLGVIGKTDKGLILVGNKQLMEKNNIKNITNYDSTVVYVAKDYEYLGCLLFSDEIKAGIKETLQAIKQSGVRTIMMLSGDRRALVDSLATKLNLDSYFAELLPQDKVQVMEDYMQNSTDITAFVGDGINDAPVLKRADIGIAMGAIGSAAAIDAADVVIMNDDIAKIATAIKIGKKTHSIVIQNVAFALIVKIAIMILAFLGISSIWLAIFADVGVALLALLNALRVLKV